MITVQRRARHDPALPLSRPELRRLAARLQDFLGLDMDLEVLVADDPGMAKLNRDFCKLPGPTNVLSFPPDHPGEPGLIAMDADALSRECVLYGQNPQEHATRLLAHALLHLAGFEHGPEMFDLTEAAVDALHATDG
jgi:probable rRNA maturation factor